MRSSLREMGGVTMGVDNKGTGPSAEDAGVKKDSDDVVQASAAKVKVRPIKMGEFLFKWPCLHGLFISRKQNLQFHKNDSRADLVALNIQKIIVLFFV